MNRNPGLIFHELGKIYKIENFYDAVRMNQLANLQLTILCKKSIGNS
jgi:hypothetical protein